MPWEYMAELFFNKLFTFPFESGEKIGGREHQYFQSKAFATKIKFDSSRMKFLFSSFGVCIYLST